MALFADRLAKLAQLLGTDGKVPEAAQTLADNATQNVSTSKHGYAPKGDGNAAHYLDGTGAYSTPAGGGSSSFLSTAKWGND